MCWCVGLIAWIENPLGRCDRLATTTSRERSSCAQAARIRRDRIDHGFQHITGLISCKYQAADWRGCRKTAKASSAAQCSNEVADSLPDGFKL
jgi:hypothetical protein